MRPSTAPALQRKTQNKDQMRRQQDSECSDLELESGSDTSEDAKHEFDSDKLSDDSDDGNSSSIPSDDESIEEVESRSPVPTQAASAPTVTKRKASLSQKGTQQSKRRQSELDRLAMSSQSQFKPAGGRRLGTRSATANATKGLL